ncbi:MULTISPECIES: Rne/Rng family ribonuclease [Candidatus Ichthyocystis]|uniref:Rne/Rng family ribonuclease n=1 Tax=Candidatus Ichthyocystis TaxID=2929841 RepID=UPI000AD027FC|nr:MULTISPECIES: Rne/Rng family ribonuclease [Ichthyocystis]
MKRMLFNAAQPEELRVAIVEGQKLLDLDIESSHREKRKSNIYVGVITRVESSLDAAFVDYGFERHGFLPFKEIESSYYSKPTYAGRKGQLALNEGQEVLVQVDKEERGSKGAALTTYISLAGRYLVLMPNNPRGGGVSRRVEGDERAELKNLMEGLPLPTGMSIIGRTAAIGRSFDELQWDLEYLLKLWDAIFEASRPRYKSQTGDIVYEETKDRVNPPAFLIYEDSSIIIRAIRDYYQHDIGEILVDSPDIYEQARQFMAHVMPHNVSIVKRYSDSVPLFSRFQIERQIEMACSRTVTLPSGGSIVFDHSEALVAVDVNSSRATGGSDIEETAFQTNLEAAEEIGRQIRLRDLGGLIVIDFIDMESAKNQRSVEHKLRESLQYDRARVQMGKISRFGLLELSRQRLRSALGELSHVVCPRCSGTGFVRNIESSGLHILRVLQEEVIMKEHVSSVHVHLPVDVATFLLNEKRGQILGLEKRTHVNIILIPSIHLETPAYRIQLVHSDCDDSDIMSYRMITSKDDAIDASVEISSFASDKSRRMKPLVKTSAILPFVSRSGTASKGILDRVWGWIRNKSAKTDSPSDPSSTTAVDFVPEEKIQSVNERNITNRRTRVQGGRSSSNRVSSSSFDGSQTRTRRRPTNSDSVRTADSVTSSDTDASAARRRAPASRQQRFSRTKTPQAADVETFCDDSDSVSRDRSMLDFGSAVASPPARVATHRNNVSAAGHNNVNRRRSRGPRRCRDDDKVVSVQQQCTSHDSASVVEAVISADCDDSSSQSTYYAAENDISEDVNQFQPQAEKLDATAASSTENFSAPAPNRRKEFPELSGGLVLIETKINGLPNIDSGDDLPASVAVVKKVARFTTNVNPEVHNNNVEQSMVQVETRKKETDAPPPHC